MITNYDWYKHGIIYEIYPASFTSEGLQGVINKLDYIKELGVDAIWLCPIFDSPFMDSGYDISDYYKINSKFGTMADFEELTKKAHDRDLKIILDIALNHSSSEHHWFKEACKSKDSFYREYYIFRDGKNNTYPNNWISSKTMKPTWTYNEQTDDYYLHIYTKYQPDFNWRSQNLREEMYSTLKFWIDKGVDGFRLDVINKIAKPPEPQNVEAERTYADYLYENQIDSHKFIKEMHQYIMKKHDGILMIGQTSGVSLDEGIEYCKEDNRELNLFLEFDHMDMDAKDKSALQKAILKWQNIDTSCAWPTVFMGSHDSSRMVNKFGTQQKKYVTVAAKMLCILQLCLKGTQIIYMGDELAVSNVVNRDISEFNDIRSKDIYKAKIKQGYTKKQVINELNQITRDNARRQIPWDLVPQMQDDKDSILCFYKKIIAWRNNEEAIINGKTESIFDEDKNIFAYQRVLKDAVITVLANMSEENVEVDCQDYGKLVLTNYENTHNNKLLPYEAKIYKK